MSFLRLLIFCSLIGSFSALSVSAQITPVQDGSTAEDSTTTEETESGYSIFMLVKTTNAWLSLSPAERFAFLDSDINPILSQHPTVEMSFFDTEGFNSRVTDVIVWKSADLDAYQSVVEALRESDFWGTYFEVVEILPGIENAYANYYDVTPY